MNDETRRAWHIEREERLRDILRREAEALARGDLVEAKRWRSVYNAVDGQAERSRFNDMLRRLGVDLEAQYGRLGKWDAD